MGRSIELAKTFARQVVCDALRVAAVSTGVWLAAVVPVLLWAEHRRAVNADVGHLPNMEPGAVVAIAAVIAIAPLAAVLLVEFVRRWAIGCEPLAIRSLLALGVLASWPVSAAFTVDWLHFGFAGIAAESGASVLAFFLVRWSWLAMKNDRIPRS